MEGHAGAARLKLRSAPLPVVAHSILLIHNTFRLSLDLWALRTSPVPPNPTRSREARRTASPTRRQPWQDR